MANIKLLNHSPARSGSDRYTCAQNHKYSVLTPQKQDIHVHIMSDTVAHLYQFTSIVVSYLLFLLWCIATTDYQISSSNINSHQQPTTGYRQTSKLLSCVSWPTGVKNTTDKIYK